MNNPLLTETQTAEMLCVSPATLRRWRWAGQGPRFRKIGRTVRYAPDDIGEFVSAASRTSTTNGEC
jgi:predicted DNA-binding transcriptional regulator AlpA